MTRILIVLTLIISLAACRGGNKGPVMETETQSQSQTQEIDYNQDATGHVANLESAKVNVDIEHGDGVLTIAQVFEQRSDLNGKTVTVKGEVVKYNPSIMGRNWVHIQDGTEFSGEFDLTITTSDEVSVGDRVTFTGILGIDRDFGYGYTYSTIVEGAALKK